jgi:hypothetical protein
MKRSSWLIHCTTALAATFFLSHASAESRHHALIIGLASTPKRQALTRFSVYLRIWKRQKR